MVWQGQHASAETVAATRLHQAPGTLVKGATSKKGHALAVVQPGAGHHRVAHVRLHRVCSIQHGADAALQAEQGGSRGSEGCLVGKTQRLTHRLDMPEMGSSRVQDSESTTGSNLQLPTHSMACRRPSPVHTWCTPRWRLPW